MDGRKRWRRRRKLLTPPGPLKSDASQVGCANERRAVRIITEPAGITQTGASQPPPPQPRRLLPASLSSRDGVITLRYRHRRLRALRRARKRNNYTKARLSGAEQLNPDGAEGFVNWKSAPGGGSVCRDGVITRGQSVRWQRACNLECVCLLENQNPARANVSNTALICVPNANVCKSAPTSARAVN